MKKNKTLWIVLIIVFIVPLAYYAWYMTQPGELDAFAQCLTDSEVTFYGTFWCPNCQDQKTMFGKSDRLIPYVECSTANGQGQLSVCQEAQITAYPTWEFADGSREIGTMSLEALSEKTGCPLP
jgi:hypothetical protein